MNIFTANQVNQVYVLKPNSNVVAKEAIGNRIVKTSNLGSVGVGITPDNKNIYFKHVGAGGLYRSDLIEIANIIDIKGTTASAMARNLIAAEVKLNTEAVDNNDPIAGEDFVLRIKFQNPIGMSPDNQYWKYGVVHTTTTTTASKFYLQLASSIAKNMSREATQLVKVFVTYSTNSKTEVTANSNIDDSSTFGQSYTGVRIEEVEQDWILGIKQQKPLVFTVEPTTIVNGDKEEVVWGDVTYSNGYKTTGGVDPKSSVIASNIPASADTVVNSKLMADYEYFYMGERADQYRMVNWPDYIPTTYMVDPTWQYGYDTVAVHYAYVGANHSVQKSEKDITFIVPRASTDSTASQLSVKATSILNAIKATLPDANTVKFSGTLVSGNVPMFDGTTGTVKDSGKAASAI